MRGGLQVLLVGLGRNKWPDTVRPNVRVRCTKCILILITRRAHRVIREGSNDDDSDYHGFIGQPGDWMVVRGHAGKLTFAGPSTNGAFDLAKDRQVDNAAPRGRRRPQSADIDWLITLPPSQGAQWTSA